MHHIGLYKAPPLESCKIYCNQVKTSNVIRKISLQTIKIKNSDKEYNIDYLS